MTQSDSGVLHTRMHLIVAVISVAVVLSAIGCSSGKTSATTQEVGADEMAAVPGIRGGSISNAFSVLRNADLRVELEEPFVLGSLRSGPIVQSQDPIAGTAVVANSVVSLGHFVPGALGSPEGRTSIPSATVPDFIGKPVADAVAWANQADLLWEASFPPLPASNAPTLLQAYVVTSQRPVPGSRLTRVENDQLAFLELEATPG